MNSPRFNNSSRRRPAMSRFAPGSHRQWIRVPELGHVRDCTNSGRKRIFAIVSRPIATGVEGKTIRRVLIFDNHPASLRLIHESDMDLGKNDDATSQREKRKSIVCGSILIAMTIAALLCPLLW